MSAAPAAALATTQLLLDSLCPDQSPELWEAERARLGAAWDDLAVRAIVFGLAPLVNRRLADWGLTPPARALAKLAATYQATANRNADIYRQLGEVLAALNREQLQPVALKGIHLAACVYDEPALRPMNDIDLLFRPEELPQAEAILETLGYGGKHKSASLGAGVTKHTATFRRETASPDSAPASTPNPYLSTESDRMVEPHGSLEESWFGLRVDITSGVRERSVVTDLAGQPVRVLSAEDLLLHLCVHFCFHLIMGAPSMVQLADLLVVSQKLRIDWPGFVVRATTVRAAPYALAALTLAHKLLGAPIPAEALTDLAARTPAGLRQRIADLGLADVLKRTQQKPLVTLRQRLTRGLADRVETASWAPDWQGRWQVWGTAFNVFATDTGQMLLGKSLKAPSSTSH